MAELSDQMAERLRTDDAEVQRLNAELKAARKRLADSIVTALKADVKPSDVGKHVSYDRNHIRRIAHAAGLPPLREPTVRSRREDS